MRILFIGFFVLIALTSIVTNASSVERKVFFVANFIEKKKESSYHTTNANDPIIKQAENLAKLYLSELQKKIPTQDGIKINLVSYNFCSGVFCGMYIPVAGKFGSYNSAAEFCDSATKNNIPCKISKISESVGTNFEYSSLCQSVPDWCFTKENM